MKKIGLVGHFVGDNSFGITKAYLKFFSFFGEVSLVSPFEKKARDLDLLVLPGGPDVNPLRYISEDEDIHYTVGKPCMQRERFDRVLLPKYIDKKTPIYGICRGHQSLNVTFGGKLIQDMYHEQNDYKDRTEKVHTLKFENLNTVPNLDRAMSKLLNEDKDFKKGYGVNSIHHQTIDDQFLPKNCTVLARHDDDDHVEAVTYYPHYPAHTVQFHSEELGDPFSILLINHLLNL